MDQKYEDFKKQVKESSDIVDVIASYISLQKKILFSLKKYLTL